MSAFELRPQADLDPAYAKTAVDIGEIDGSTLRLLDSAQGVSFYLADSTTDGERFCIFAARKDSDGVASAYTCAARRYIGTGQIRLNLQLRPGGFETPRVFFGLVPDGVRSAEIGAQTAEVENNAYALTRPNGDQLGKTSFTLADGTVVAAPLPAQ